jgi:pyruvate kinase
MHTRILFTHGPSCDNAKVFESLAGMSNGMRINTAHGDMNAYKAQIMRARKFGLACVLDLKGTELRAEFKSQLRLEKGATLQLGAGGACALSRTISGDVRSGDAVIFKDGIARGKIVSVSRSYLSILMESAVELSGSVSLHVPNRSIGPAELTARDRDCIKISNSCVCEYAALSCCGNADDVLELRRALDKRTGVIAKIESSDGLANIEEIVGAADGVMVARGGLGSELGYEKVPLAQKKIIRMANESGKLSITATQVLESMILNSEPTRAEASDIANAILDGTDCIMLSGETAMGKYPLECANAIRTVACEVERNAELPQFSPHGATDRVAEAMSRSLKSVAESLNVRAIACVTRTGYSARMASRFRLKQPILALTESETVARRLALHYGIVPVASRGVFGPDMVRKAARILLGKGLAKPEDLCAFSAGTYSPQGGASNSLEVHTLSSVAK